MEEGITWAGAEASPETIGFLENKGFDTPDKMITGYQELEAFQGVPKDRLLKLPDPEDTDANWDEIHTRLGKPESSEGYELPVPDGDDGAFAKQASEWMHEIGMSKDMAQKLTVKWNEHMAAQGEESSEATELKNTTEMAELKSDWGDKYDERMEISRRGQGAAKVTDEQLDSMEQIMGPKWVLNHMAMIGDMVSESSAAGFEDGNKTFGLSKGQAEAKITELKSNDDWKKRYMNGGQKERRELNDLQKIAAGIAA